MKWFGKGLLVFVIASLGLASSCAVNEFDLDREVDERELKQVTLGMSFNEFQSLFPQRISRGAKICDFGTLIAYEAAYTYYSFVATGAEHRSDFAGTERVVTWFFFLNDRFLNDRLIKVGEEDSWPTEAELNAAR